MPCLDSGGVSRIGPVRVQGTHAIEEQFQARLSRDYLEQHRATGLNIRFNGKYGSLVVPMPAVYVDGFLQRFDAEKSKLGR
jgi:hypothetical protein